MKIILASASGRRQDLLRRMGLPFETVQAELDESRFAKRIKKPAQLVTSLAKAKASTVRKKLRPATPGKYLIIAADTMVVFKGRIIGKPESRQMAVEILHGLSGKQHQVITGISIWDKSGRSKTTTVITSVWFKKLTRRQIDDYLDLGFFTDRAGAYGIQDPKCNFVKKYKGSYTNILGLPLEMVMKWLKEFGYKIPKVEILFKQKKGVRKNE